MSRIPRSLWIKAIQKLDGRCWFCGQEAKTIDHATPRSLGGRNSMDNLLPSCVWCNNTKADMAVSGFRKYLRALMVRRLIDMGYAAVPNLHGKVNIVFYGEGNISPFNFSEFLVTYQLRRTGSVESGLSASFIEGLGHGRKL